jgi:HAD superfamily phosphoserine phosphatase-like hydrolase
MKLAIFDFDGTLFPVETLPFLLSQWKKLKYSKTRYYKTYIFLMPLYLKYKTGINSDISREQMKNLAVEKFNNIFIGMKEDKIRNYFFKSSKEAIELLDNTLIQEVYNARSDGFHTVLLSGAYELFLDNIGKYLGIDTIISSKIYFKNGLFDSDKKIELIRGISKLEKVIDYFKADKIDWENSQAYADSFSDVYILQSVGQAVAVNPDEKLYSMAQKLNWKIILSR